MLKLIMKLMKILYQVSSSGRRNFYFFFSNFVAFRQHVNVMAVLLCEPK